MNPFQKVLALICSIPAVLLICGAPGPLMFYLRDSISEIIIWVGVSVILFVTFMVGSIYCLSRFALSLFERYLNTLPPNLKDE